MAVNIQPDFSGWGGGVGGGQPVFGGSAQMVPPGPPQNVFGAQTQAPMGPPGPPAGYQPPASQQQSSSGGQQQSQAPFQPTDEWALKNTGKSLADYYKSNPQAQQQQQPQQSQINFDALIQPAIQGYEQYIQQLQQSTQQTIGAPNQPGSLEAQRQTQLGQAQQSQQTQETALNRAYSVFHVIDLLAVD